MHLVNSTCGAGVNGCLFSHCRQLALCHFPCAMLVLFARFILSVPACVLHLQQHATEVTLLCMVCVTVQGSLSSFFSDNKPTSEGELCMSSY